MILVPPPPRIPIADASGNITRPWSLYFQDVFSRIGGTTGPSNAELSDEIAGLQGSSEAANLGIFGRQINAPQQPADIAHIDAFLPRRDAPETPPNDASAVICERVFAVRN